MSKAILVMDMPDSCDKCSLFGNHYSDMCCRALNNRGINYPYPDSFVQEWCPLKSIPNKKLDDRTAYDKAVSIGWNACIDEILGE